MTFISYAQNFEDVMLWRALKHLKKGFYIDVGAAWPDEHSVTKAFYERGWSGVNIEPNPAFYKRLETKRPRDSNVRTAVGDHNGNQFINLVGETGLSTLIDAVAEIHHNSGWPVEKEEVRVTTLETVWSTYVPQSQDVHFLKIDVEGMEEAVLRGNNWRVNRPWIVVVEATLPLSQMSSHENWEPILLEAGYKYAYGDGLNRFYVAGEKPELMGSFIFPPNFFDHFRVFSEIEAESREKEAIALAQQAEAKQREAEAKAWQARSAAAEAHANAERVQAALHEVHISRSWRLTRPLRWFAHQLRMARAQGIRERAKRGIAKVSRALVLSVINFIRRRPALRNFVLKTVALTRTCRTVLSRYLRIMQGSRLSASPREVRRINNAHDMVLSQRASRICEDLKKAIDAHQEGG